jgi:hypothetical protein
MSVAVAFLTGIAVGIVISVCSLMSPSFMKKLLKGDKDAPNN